MGIGETILFFIRLQENKLLKLNSETLGGQSILLDPWERNLYLNYIRVGYNLNKILSQVYR